jgi:DNA adenine methylase
VEHVVLVELDSQVAAVWETLLGGDAEWLAERILTFDLTRENVIRVLETQENDVREAAFRTILKNRTFHGGIMAPGSSLIKSGENGKGLKSRWYPETLANRIRDIGRIRDRFTFIRGDGIEALEKYGHLEHVAFFIDPPYTAGGRSGKRAGARLYTHHSLDHDLLFCKASGLRGDVLLTYDDAADVRALADRYGLAIGQVSMKNTHHATMTELLIGKNMRWLV